MACDNVQTDATRNSQTDWLTLATYKPVSSQLTTRKLLEWQLTASQLTLSLLALQANNLESLLINGSPTLAWLFLHEENNDTGYSEAAIEGVL